MRKITLCLFALVLSLSLFGCKNDVFNASITEVFYTDDDPDEVGWDHLFRTTFIHNGRQYNLYCDFHQPNKDAVKLIEVYGDTEYSYNLNPEHLFQQSVWKGISWTIPQTQRDVELTYYLEDANGRRSAPYVIKVNFYDY